MVKATNFPFGEHTPALLALEDGSIFHGISIGVDGQTSGEVVFNTSMTGYQEILTDPSYSHQLVTLTYPHIGNTGINEEDVESDKIHVAGLIIKDLPLLTSNFRTQQPLGDYLKKHNVVGISGIDTRRLTRILRETGAQNGAIITGEVNVDKALAAARSFPGLKGLDLAKVVSTKQVYHWNEMEWKLQQENGKPGYGKQTDPKFHVVVYDYGVKRNILRMLTQRGCKLTVLPAQASAEEALALNPDGIFLSNGPGDPEPCDYAISTAKTVIDKGIPTFGICLGHQIMAQASGAKTLKMPFGHHGANHPVQDLDSKKVLITSQNHGFAVDAATLPSNCKVTHVSLFDGSLQGFARTDQPAFCFQGHPEASPGPQDIGYLFDRFIGLMENHKNA